jgi:hypothetical protein
MRGTIGGFLYATSYLKTERLSPRDAGGSKLAEEQSPPAIDLPVYEDFDTFDRLFAMWGTEC